MKIPISLLKITEEIGNKINVVQGLGGNISYKKKDSSYIKAIKDLPRMRTIKIISRKELVKNKNLINNLKKENLNAKIRILENTTNGSEHPFKI